MQMDGMHHHVHMHQLHAATKCRWMIRANCMHAPNADDMRQLHAATRHYITAPAHLTVSQGPRLVHGNNADICSQLELPHSEYMDALGSEFACTRSIGADNHSGNRHGHGRNKDVQQLQSDSFGRHLEFCDPGYSNDQEQQALHAEGKETEAEQVLQPTHHRVTGLRECDLLRHVSMNLTRHV